LGNFASGGIDRSRTHLHPHRPSTTWWKTFAVGIRKGSTVSHADYRSFPGHAAFYNNHVAGHLEPCIHHHDALSDCHLRVLILDDRSRHPKNNRKPRRTPITKQPPTDYDRYDYATHADHDDNSTTNGHYYDPSACDHYDNSTTTTDHYDDSTPGDHHHDDDCPVHPRYFVLVTFLEDPHTPSVTPLTMEAGLGFI
jgi:hypothetical protein